METRCPAQFSIASSYTAICLNVFLDVGAACQLCIYFSFCKTVHGYQFVRKD